MPWKFYFQKHGWESFTEDANTQINEALSQEPLPEIVYFTHYWGKNNQTEYELDLKNMIQKQKNGTRRKIQAWWDDDWKQPFEWHKESKRSWGRKDSEQEPPRGDSRNAKGSQESLEEDPWHSCGESTDPWLSEHNTT